MDMDRLISDRARAIDASGIRRIFDLGARLKDPINLSIGQPDFPVPEPIKRAAIRAIETDHNGYTPTQGIPSLQAKVTDWLKTDLGWDAKPAGSAAPGQPSTLITTGTSGALSLAFAALLDPGDEAIIPDPYFVAYPHLCALAGAKGVLCDTGEDLRMTAERVEPLITQRTKLVLLNSPSNPCGVVSTPQECRDLLELCRAKGVLLISDEIYDEFTYPEFALDKAVGDPSISRCPSPARLPGAQEDVLLIRGFGKTYACTGWRLGYAAGPRELIAEMAKIQQYTFVCAPSAFQHGVSECFSVDMSDQVRQYQRRRDYVVDRLAPLTDVPTPGGAFYAFPKIPAKLRVSDTEFVDRCIERNVLIIPGSVFSSRTDRIRISYATKMEQLERGLDAICELMG